MRETPIFTVDEAAKYLKIPAPTVRALARSGKLRGRKLGKEWRFTEAQLIAAIEAPSSDPYRPMGSTP